MIAGELVRGLGPIGEMRKIVGDLPSAVKTLLSFYESIIKSPIYAFYNTFNFNGAIRMTTLWLLNSTTNNTDQN